MDVYDQMADLQARVMAKPRTCEDMTGCRRPAVAWISATCTCGALMAGLCCSGHLERTTASDWVICDTCGGPSGTWTSYPLS